MYFIYRRWDRKCGMWLCYGVDNQGIMNLSLLQSVLTSSELHTASYWMGMRGSFLGVNWIRHEVKHSPPSSVEVNEYSSPSTPPYAFMACTGTTFHVLHVFYFVHKKKQHIYQPCASVLWSKNNISNTIIILWFYCWIQTHRHNHVF